MRPPTFGGFREPLLGESFDPSQLQISRGIFKQGLTHDLQSRMQAIERGDFGGLDASEALRQLNIDLMLNISRAQLSTGIPVREDLEAPATLIIPTDTPLRNRLPRSQGSGVASSWDQQTSIGGGYGISTTVTSGATSATQTVGSTAGMQVGMSLYFQTSQVYGVVSSITNSTTVVLTNSITTTTSEVVTMGPYSELGQAPQQAFFGESGAPATLKATYSKITEGYKLLGTMLSITGFAMAAGATFDNQLALEKRAAILRLMLIEEYALINGQASAVYAPFGDGTNAYGFDGILNLATTANGCPGSHIQTSVGALTLAHMDAQLTRVYNDGGMNQYILVNAQEAQSLVHLATGSGSINRIMGSSEGKVVVGATATHYVHPVTSQLVPILVSRFMPAGTIFFGSDQGPDGQVAMDVRVLPQVQLPELAPDVQIQGYTAQELAPATSSPQVYPAIVSVYEVLRMKNANCFGKSTGVTAV